MPIKTGVSVRSNAQSLNQLRDSLVLLMDNEVLVGFPEDTTERVGDADEGITNAALAYIHDNGSPEVNIPARPFMIPAIESIESRVTATFASVTNAVIKRGADETTVEVGFHKVGLEAKLAIQNKIEEGIPPPLADSTLRARARKRKGRVGPGIELLSRSQGYEPSTDFVKPLIDTGAMRNAANYVIRSRKQRKK